MAGCPWVFSVDRYGYVSQGGVSSAAGLRTRGFWHGESLREYE
ncbi:hypothetical protein [Cobetia crustatorum]|nr:hypothetical protein [Cobetia crustatorum]